MSLLREIQNGATDDTTSLSSLLRKMKLLAARLRVQEIAFWADKELNGGYAADDLPDYRGPFVATVLGDSFGPFGSGVKNFPLPPLAFPEDMRKGPLFRLSFYQSIAELEELVSRNADLQEPWPPDAVQLIERLMEGGLLTMTNAGTWANIRKVIPRSLLVGTLDAVRSRILDFTIRLDQIEPNAHAEHPEVADPARVQQVFNTVVYQAGNVAVGGSDVQQTIQLPAAGDDGGLISYLAERGVTQPWLDDLHSVLDEGATTGAVGDDRQKSVLSWLKRFAAENASSAASTVVITATQAVLHHLGI